MKRSTIIWRSLADAAGTFFYVAGVAWFMFNAGKIFDGADSFVAPLFLLLLFVISATITGLLVLGKPAALYLGGQKKESLFLLLATLGWLVIFVLISAAVLAAK